MAWRLDISVETDGAGEAWNVFLVDDTTSPPTELGRLHLPEPVLRFVNRIRQARPSPSATSWSVSLPAGLKLGHRLGRLFLFFGTFLRDPGEFLGGDD